MFNKITFFTTDDNISHMISNDTAYFHVSLLLRMLLSLENPLLLSFVLLVTLVPTPTLTLLPLKFLFTPTTEGGLKLNLLNLFPPVEVAVAVAGTYPLAVVVTLSFLLPKEVICSDELLSLLLRKPMPVLSASMLKLPITPFLSIVSIPVFPLLLLLSLLCVRLLLRSLLMFTPPN